MNSDWRNQPATKQQKEKLRFFGCTWDHVSSQAEFFAHLREITNSQCDAVALARLMPVKAVEKYDDFIPEQLLDVANARARLDILGASEAAAQALHAV